MCFQQHGRGVRIRPTGEVYLSDYRDGEESGEGKVCSGDGAEQARALCGKFIREELLSWATEVSDTCAFHEQVKHSLDRVKHWMNQQNQLMHKRRKWWHLH